MVSFSSLSTFFVVPTLLLLATVRLGHGASGEPSTEFSTPPVVSVTNVTEGAFYNRDITPRIVIKSRNLRKSTATLNGAPYVTETPIATEGKHLLLITAEDENNVTVHSTITFVIDKTPPVTALQILGGTRDSKGSVYITGSASIEISPQDGGVVPSGVYSTECRFNGEDRQQFVKTISLSNIGEGTHTIYCSSTDRAGNSEEEKKLTFTLSKSPPTTVITLSPPHKAVGEGKFLASPSTVLSLFASGSPSGIASTQYKIDDGPWIDYAQFTIPQEGEHRISYRSTDKLGISESEKTVTVIIDRKPPVTTLHLDGPRFSAPGNRLFISPATVFKAEATSPVIGIAKTEYRVDNRRWMEYAPFSIPDEGKHLVEVRSTDAVGNVEQQSPLHVTTDATPPLTKIFVDGQHKNPDEVFFSRGTNAITLSAADKLSGVNKTQFRLDGKNWKDYTPLQLTDQKTQTLEYRSIDNVGNEEEIKTLTVRLDADPPVSRIEPGTPHVVKDDVHISEQTPLIIKATDSVSGVATTEYRIDGARWLPYSPFKLSGPGKHVVEYRSSDVAGNQETARSLTVFVDTSSPVTGLSVASKKLAPGEDTIFLTGKVPLELKGTSPVWKITSTEYRIDGGDWIEYTSPISLKNEGEYLLEFKSSDTGGKVEEPKAVTVIVDTEAPQSTMKIGNPRHELEGVMHIETGTTLSPEATDDLSGVERVEYQLKGHPVETDAIPFSIATSGTYELTHWSIDKAGNREAPKTVKLVVSPAPTRFSPEDLLLANEIASPSPEPSGPPPVVNVEEKVVASPAVILAEPPPEMIETVTSHGPPKKSLLNWTMGVLQVILIIGVMAL